MKVEIVTPARKGSTSGNRMTAQRYARILRDLGAPARVVERWSGSRCDLLVALHAGKSARSVDQFARAHPEAARLVVLTGTDLYGEADERVERSLALASGVIVLQPEALARLSGPVRSKARVILQSAGRASGTPRELAGVFEVAALAHLRAVKDPFLAAEAARMLPAGSRLRVSHVGRALERGIEREARAESATNPRWRWLGERSHAAGLLVLARARAFVQTSRDEGGSLALAEAVVAGKPIVCARNDGSVGMLGHDHPGFFPVGDARALAALFERLEQDALWREALAARSAALAPRHALDAEREAWRATLASLGFEPRPRVHDATAS